LSPDLAGALVVLQLGFHVPLGGHEHPAQVVAGVLRLGSNREEAVSRNVEQQHSVRRQFFIGSSSLFMMTKSVPVD
jgi:hypothetical protein